MADNPEATEESQTERERARRRDYTPGYGKPDRQPASERDTAFNLFMWLLEGATGALEELRRNDLGLSEEFWVHTYAARQETLLAMRAALDTLIEKTSAVEKQEQERQKRQERRGGIDIEF